MAVNAVIFDLDGLLTDTEVLHCRAYQKTLADIGYELTEQEFGAHWIRDGKSIRDLCALRKFSKGPEELHSAKVALYRELVACECRPMPGAMELLEKLKGRKRMALATASFKDSAGSVVEAMKIAGYFEVILTGSDVTRLKPHPDLFLEAASRLGVAPAECVVLEDAEKGIVAAHRAGMKSIAVPTSHTAGNDFSLATWRVGSLAEVRAEWLGIGGGVKWLNG